MANGIEQGHAANPVGGGAERGQADIHPPQGASGLGNARGQFVVATHARRFGAEQLSATDFQHRQNRHRQHDDPDATEELQHLTIKQHAARQEIQTHDDGGAGSGQS